MRAQNGERQPLEKPWVRRSLQEDLAKSTASQTALARKYGVTGPSITAFKQKYRAVIEEIRENAADQFAGIALARQVNRIELYQSELEKAEEREDWKAIARLGRQIAEELGHLPGRVTLSGEVGTTTRYSIEGVENGDLT